MPTNNTSSFDTINNLDLSNGLNLANSQNGSIGNEYTSFFTNPLGVNNNTGEIIFPSFTPANQANKSYVSPLLDSSFSLNQNQGSSPTYVDPFNLSEISNAMNMDNTNSSTKPGFGAAAQTVVSKGAKVASDATVRSTLESVTTNVTRESTFVETSPTNNSTSSSVTTNSTYQQGTVSNDDVFERMMSNRQTSGAGSSTENILDANASSNAENDAKSDGITYTVKEGDNLSSILKEQTGDGSYENYMRVAKENGIDDPNRIQVGQTITINPSSVTGGNGQDDNTSGVVTTDSSGPQASVAGGNNFDLQQIQFLNSDLYTEVKADEHKEFMYDCEQDTSLNAIKDVIEKAGDLKTATSTLEKALDALATGVYANKTEVKKQFDSTIQQMGNRNNQINDSINEWCEGVKAFYEDQVSSNQELLNDLQAINDYLDDGSFSDWNM